MKCLLLFCLLSLLTYIKSQASISITNSEIRSLNASCFHYLINVTVTNINSLTAMTIVNANNANESYESKCSTAGDITYCYFTHSAKIDVSNTFSITKYNSITYSGTSFQFNQTASASMENVVYTISANNTDSFYKNYQSTVGFLLTQNNPASSLFILSMQKSITVKSTSYQTPIDVICKIADDTRFICSFDTSYFKFHFEDLTFTFSSLYDDVQPISIQIDTSTLTSIDNAVGWTSSTSNVERTFTIHSDQVLSANIASHLSLRATSNSTPISLTCSSPVVINLECTASITPAVKYYLYFDEDQILSLHVAIYTISYVSNTDIELHIGELYIKQAFTLHFTPRLTASDISSISYENENYETFDGVISNNYANGTVNFGIKYVNVKEPGNYTLKFNIGSQSYATEEIIPIGEHVGRPKFVQYEETSYIRVNDNTSVIKMIFNATDMKEAATISDIYMLTPIGGNVYNCITDNYTINGVAALSYGQTCNVSATQAGNAIFEYNVLGKKETVPLTFPIQAEISSAFTCQRINLVIFLLTILCIYI